MRQTNATPSISTPISISTFEYWEAFLSQHIAISASVSAPRIAIIGRGFSGAAAAAALLRGLKGSFSLTLIDETDTIGGGLAYGKARSGELLNVCARDLGLVAGERGDFAGWLENRLTGRREMAVRVEINQIFAPRLLFRDYVRERLVAEIDARPDASTNLIYGKATALDEVRGAYRVRIDDGRIIDCDAVIVATGFGGASRRLRFGADPFAPISEDEAVAARKVVIVGAGLTMVDALLRLRRLGCPAPITIISRRGVAPLSQLPQSPFPEFWTAGPQPTALLLLKAVRRACQNAAANGVPWQAVINGIRPEVSRLWRALPHAEQSRLLRHARAYWEIHRHRLPADVMGRLQRELSLTRTNHRAGRVLGVTPGDPQSVLVRWRGEKRAAELSADIVIDCSGRQPDLDDPLIADLVAKGFARIDRHRIGLEVEPDGRLFPRTASDRGRLFAIGPLGAGSLMEIAAAPEIAEQARAMASALRESLSREIHSPRFQPQRRRAP